MAGSYFSIVTNTGTEKMMEAISENKKVEITEFAVGDGNGAYYEPTQNMTELQREIWRGQVNSCKISKENKNVMIVKSVIPSSVGGFTIREMAVFDKNGNMIAVCNTPETQKVKESDGVVHELMLSMEILLSNTDGVQLIVDPNVVTAKEKDLESLRSDMEEALSELRSQVLWSGALFEGGTIDFNVPGHCIRNNHLDLVVDSFVPGKYTAKPVIVTLFFEKVFGTDRVEKYPYLTIGNPIVKLRRCDVTTYDDTEEMLVVNGIRSRTSNEGEYLDTYKVEVKHLETSTTHEASIFTRISAYVPG